MDHEWNFLGFEPMATQSHSPAAVAGQSSFKCENCGMEARVGRVRKTVRTPPTLDEIHARADPNEELFSGKVTDITCSGEQVRDVMES